MSYQLSATPDMDIPANDKELATKQERKLYAHSYMAIKREYNRTVTNLGIGDTFATTAQGAEILAMALAKKNFPECDGWIGHRVAVYEITPEALAKLGYHR